MPEMPIPFGDDVSACDLGNGNLAVLKTDMLVGKTDVPMQMSLWQAARKAVVMNVSDFASKGVRPLVALASLGLPADMKRKDIEEIGSGLNAGAREYKTYVIGGDTNEASDLVISLSVFGTARREKVMLRSGAKAGDIVAVTGFFGRALAGLKIVTDKFEASGEIRRVLVDSVLMPRARLREGLTLSETGAVTASVDSSDGLAWSLHEISEASGVGFLIDNLPISDDVERFAEKNKLSSTELALYGGEEYELVVTVKPQMWEETEDAVQTVGGELLKIGTTTSETKNVLNTGGTRTVIEPRGWEHFKKAVQ